MKHILPLSLALALPAFAGTPATVAPAPAPAPAPALTEWFIGGSYGQVDGIETGLLGATELDFDMYTLHFGRQLTCLGGFNIATYLEVAYLDGDFNAPANNLPSVDFSVEMLPVTLNLSAKRNLIGGLGVYATIGAGYAWNNVEASNIIDENDGGFIAQASAGLVYNFNEAFEVYGGARWLYLDEVNFIDAGSAADSDAWGWEAGLRYNF